MERVGELIVIAALVFFAAKESQSIKLERFFLERVRGGLVSLETITPKVNSKIKSVKK